MKKRPLITYPITLLLLSTIPAIFASDTADHDWKTIEKIEKGPNIQPSNPTNATSVALQHLAAQRQAIENFLSKHPLDERVPLANLKLAEILAAQGVILSNDSLVKKALTILSRVESHPTANSKLKATAAFRRISILIQTLPGTPEENYRQIASAASSFASRFSNDSRAARLLVEAATVCDADPSLKRQLLDKARHLTRDQTLQLRIRDDLHKLNLLGKSTNPEMPELRSGRKIPIHPKNQPAIVIFWSPQSPHSLLWLEDFEKEWEKFQISSYSIITIAVSDSRKAVLQYASRFPKKWLSFHEPGGWEAPTIRNLGINALPSVWVLNSQSVLRSINAKSSWKNWITTLARRD